VRSSTTIGASRVGGFATSFGTLGVSQNAGILMGDSRVRREESEGIALTDRSIDSELKRENYEAKIIMTSEDVQ
jgi:hypothetical protein